MNHTSGNPFHAAIFCLWCTAVFAFAQTPPAMFTQVISTANASVTVDFVLRPIRGSNFGVIVQQADGSYANHVADVPRTYLGTVRERPGAVAGGLLRANGTLWAHISFETGAAWTTKGGVAVAMATGGSSPLWTNQVTGAGGAGTNVYAVEVGIDATYSHFLACGSTPEGVLDSAEFSLMAINLPYLRDAGIENRLGKLVVRAHQSRDPYQPDGSDKSLLLQRVRALWTQGNPMGTTHHLASLIHSGLNGGLAYNNGSGVIGTSLAYSVSDSDNGDFWRVFRHEAGHNWGCGHTEGGGRTEGATIMSGDNALSRLSSADLVKITNHRATRTGLQNLGPYPLPLPPRANLDTAYFLRNSPVTMDVLANDSDMNGEALTLLTSNITTTLGGSVTRLEGAGPEGRDVLQYTPPPALGSGTDWFRYRIEDSSGMMSEGFAVVRPRAMGLSLADHWRLDDGTGDLAVNQVRASHNGARQNGVLSEQPGATPVTRTGMDFDGVDDRVRIPAPTYNTANLTMTAWIRRDGNQNTWAPVVFSRSFATAAGIGFGSNNELRYHWSNMGYTWQPSPALVPPDNEWCLVALSVSPTGAELFLRSSEGLQSARNAVTHIPEPFIAAMYLGHDTGGSSRYFKGGMDDVRIYRNTLTGADIESLYQQAVNPPSLALTEPEAGATVPGLNIPVAASVGSSGELVDRVDFMEDGSVLATDSSAPYETAIPLWEAGERTLMARAIFGDWGYQIDSAPVSLMVLPPHPPVVSVTASPPASKWGPTPGVFTFTRDHGYGEVTVSFVLSGNAVAGTDYESLPVSITFEEGQLTQTLEVMPIAAGPDAAHEELTLTLEPGSGYGIGTSTAATLTIGDHATYTWTQNGGGSWNTAGNWDSNPNAPIFGPDVVVDFSQINITANRDLNLGSAGKIVGRIIFGDKTTPSNHWNIIAQNGPLTLQSTIGQPIIETKDWQSIITVRLAGAQGFEKTGANMLRLDNTDNPITGEILVSQGILQIRNGSVNGPVVFTGATMNQRSLRITGPGILDLPRLDASGSQNITWSLPAITLENAGTLRFRNNNAATYNHSMAAALTVGTGGGSLLNNGGSGVQNITLGGALSGSGALAYLAGSGATRQINISGSNNTFSGDWSVAHTGGGTAILRAGASNALGTGTVTVGGSGQLLNEHATGLDSLSGVALNGTDATLKLNQPWNNSAAYLTMNSGTSVVEVGDAASVIGNLSGDASATLRGTGEASALTVNQTIHQGFAGAIGPDLHLIKSGPARLELSGELDAGLRLTAAQGELALNRETAEIAALVQTEGDLSLNLADETTAPLTVNGDYTHTGGVLRVDFPDSGIEFGASYPIIAYGGSLTGQPPVEFTGPVSAVVDYGSGSNSAITVTFLAGMELIVEASPPEGGEVSGSGFYAEGGEAAITATPAPGWRFAGWEGEGLGDPDDPAGFVIMDEPKTVTARFITAFQSWVKEHDLEDDDALPTADPDGDGLINGQEWILGGDPSQQDAASLVSTTRPPGSGLTLNFTREPDSIPFADLAVEYSNDLENWNSVPIGVSGGGPDENGVTVGIDDSGSPHQVTVTIPATNEQSGRLFSRLAVQPK